MLEEFTIVYNSYIAVLVSSCPAWVCKKTPCLQRLGCQGSCVLCSLIRMLPLVVSVSAASLQETDPDEVCPPRGEFEEQPLVLSALRCEPS